MKAVPPVQRATEKPRAPRSSSLVRFIAETAPGPSRKTDLRTRTICRRPAALQGPRVKAAVQIPAGDWITNRADGSYRLDVRLTLKTDDGALILVTYNGIGPTTETGASLRIAPLFETGDSRYVWLTRLQAVGVGERVGTAVKYDLYALK